MARAGTRTEPRKKYICKFCKVQVVSPTVVKAIWGKEHKDCCPRKDK